MKSILIVDDDPAVLELLGRKLRGRYRVLATPEGSQALPLAIERHPDLVLCDFDMPKINGAEVVALLRKEFGTKVPVVYLTGLVTPAEAKEGTMRGERVIAKQAPLSELLDCIKSLIGE